MERKRVNASTIRSAGYDARNRLLEIEFSNGSIFQYSGVSEEVYRRLMSDPSPAVIFATTSRRVFPPRGCAELCPGPLDPAGPPHPKKIT